MVESTSAVIESQVDYLTVSAHAESRARQLSDLADDLLIGAERLGNQRAGWRSMGYIGYHCGQVDWGRRDERQAILRLSGQSASDHFLKALSVSDNVTRCDLAVTWRAVPPDPHLGENAYSNADMFYHSSPRSPRPSRTSDGDGGFTCYLGDRRSPYYARIYNKEAERASRADANLAQHYAGCWRYEVEAHDQRAIAVASTLADAGDQPAWIQEWVYQWFTARGVPPAFPRTGAAVLVAGFHRRSDDETRLRHLARNVAPTIRRLRDHGREADLRAALDIDRGEASLRELSLLLKAYEGILPHVTASDGGTKEWHPDGKAHPQP